MAIISLKQVAERLNHPSQNNLINIFNDNKNQAQNSLQRLLWQAFLYLSKEYTIRHNFSSEGCGCEETV